MKSFSLVCSLFVACFVTGCDAVRLPWVEPVSQERRVPPPPPMEPINPIILDGELIDVPGHLPSSKSP